MISTFFSLEAAKRGLMAHMAAIDVTGQNIANANTEGYSRQQAVLTNLGPIGPAGGEAYESIGRGVTVQLIQRIKDDFLEDEIRNQRAVENYWDSNQETLERIENLLLEPSDSGIRSLMDKFWSSLEDLTAYPDDPSYRTATIQAGNALAGGTQYVEEQLTFLKGNVDDQIRQNVDIINTRLDSIAKINGELKVFETDSVKLNDLRDERDRYLEEVAGLLDIRVMDNGQLDDSRIMLDGRILVDGDMVNHLTYENGTSESIYPELRFENESRQFSTERSVVNGRALSTAVDGTYRIEVKSMASEMKVENPGLINDLTTKDYLSKVDGIESGSFFVNGVEITVDPTETTLENFAAIINQANAGVNVEVTEVGRLILHAEQAGQDPSIHLTDGSGNILRSLGLVSEVTGKAYPPVIDPDASLNIGGAFFINGKRVEIQQGKTDSLSRIAEEINAGVPELEANVITDVHGLQQIKLVNREDPFATITLEDTPGGNVLHRLGIISVPFVPTTIQGPTVTNGTDAVFTVNGKEYRTNTNNLTHVVNGVELNLHGIGKAEVFVDNLVHNGKIQALLEARDEIIPGYQDDFFQFMKTFTDSINRIHYQNFAANGETHINFFTPMPDKLGNSPQDDALLKLAINPDLLNDHSLLATAGLDMTHFAETGELRSQGAGDNTGALELAQVRFDPVFNDGSNLLDRYSQIFVELGIKGQATKASQFTQSQIMLNLTNRRESISGVSLDEEMTNLVKYQHGYSAAARMINTVNQMLDVLVNQLGR